MTMQRSDIDSPAVLHELRQVFDDYERALMANDVAALNRYFWDDARTTRYGIADRQWGLAEITAFRAGTPAPGFTRVLQHPRITAYGSDTAVAQTEFVRSDTSLRGFQTQTWVRFADGWKIVAAHVSMIPFDARRSAPS
jgi:ketosteroid isomerase-like protein